MGWGDRFRSWLGGAPRAQAIVAEQPRRVVFSGVESWRLPTDQLVNHFLSKLGAIGRPQALSVPAVRRGRNMICAISTLPLQAVDESNRVRQRPLFQQLDSNTPNVVVLAQTIEDLFFDAVAWWRVVGFDADGYPSRIRRYDVGTVSLQPPDDYQAGYLPSGLATEGVVWMDGHPVPFAEVIRFDSPNPGLLTDDPDVVRRAIALGQAAALYAATPRRRGYFRPVEGADPAEDDAIVKILDDWQRASSDRVDGYVPAAMEYNAIQDSTPAELQLVQMQQQTVLDLACMLGLDPEDLGASTTSRTYQNATDRRKDRVNDALAPYMRAITDRLGMPDVTREGERVRFALDDYFQADPKTRAEVRQIYHGLGVTDAAEIREEEGKPPRTITPPAAATDDAAVLAPRRVPSSLGSAES